MEEGKGPNFFFSATSAPSETFIHFFWFYIFKIFFERLPRILTAAHISINQLTFTCSKSILETLEKDVEIVES